MTQARQQASPRRLLPSRDISLLLGPTVLYLFVFSLFPLIYSLYISFTDLRAADSTGVWIGLRNYADLLTDEFFWNASINTAVMVGAAVTIQVVLGTALALF